MSYIIDDYYSGDKVKTYEKGRSQNPKWHFEKDTLLAVLQEHSQEILTILDAPIGTGRFLENYAKLEAEVQVTGLDYSDDMLRMAAAKAVNFKLNLLKHDIIRFSIPMSADLVVCYRFLNLIPLVNAVRTLKILLTSTKKYCLLAIRMVPDDYISELYIENKIYLHRRRDIIDTLWGEGFEIVREHKFDDSRDGQYTILFCKYAELRSHVVVRAANERTASASESLIKRQCPLEAKITTVNQYPFEKALRASYQSGIDAGLDWTITVDADTLLLPGAIRGLVAAAEAMPQNYVQLQGRVFDKIMGVYRQAGLRIYRTALLNKAINMIPDPGQAIRPEYATLQAMGELGHPSRFMPDIFALHDFEQFYFDLYRKAFVHARKHTWLVGPMLERCRANLFNDPDFRFILKGLWDGLTTDNAVSIDRRIFVEKGENVFKELGINEKASLKTEAFIRDFEAYAVKTMRDYEAPPMEIYDRPIPPIPPGLRGSVVHRIRKKGMLGGSIASFGALLCKFGRLLDS